MQAVTAVALIALASSQSTTSKDEKLPIGPKRTVAVTSFDVKIGASNPTTFTFGGGLNNNSGSGGATNGTIAIPNAAEFGSGLTEVMITVLTDTKAFTVIDVPAPSQLGGATAPTTGDLPQYYMKAVVSEVSCRERSGGINFGGLGVGQGQYENKVTLDVRLIDPTTNVVIESVKATGKKTSTSSMFGGSYAFGSIYDPDTKVLNLSYGDFESSPLAEAARLAIQDAATKLRDKVGKRPWESAVLKVMQEDSGLELYLNLPGDCGLKVGDKLELCRYGEEILDPKTNLPVGRTRPKVMGTVEVFMTDADRVICKPTGTLTTTLTITDAGLFVRLPRP